MLQHRLPRASDIRAGAPGLGAVVLGRLRWEAGTGLFRATPERSLAKTSGMPPATSPQRIREERGRSAARSAHWEWAWLVSASSRPAGRSMGPAARPAARVRGATPS